jgi:hypothetical protein
VNVRTLPVEAYRQTNEQPVKKDGAVKKESIETGRSSPSDKITLPGKADVEAASLRLDKSPSLLSQVLSSEERDLLVKYFARYGDAPEDSQIYEPGARTKSAPLIGTRVDLRG